MRKLNRVLLVLFLSVLPVLADEPIMNMMPRWDHGWGLQFVESGPGAAETGIDQFRKERVLRKRYVGK